MTNKHRLLPGWFWLLVGGVLLWPGALRAANARETQAMEDQALKAAQALFDDQQYAQAESRLAAFLSTYTNSPHRPYARLYEARARFGQSNYDGAIQLLTNFIPQAGLLAGEYAFWIARARLEKGDYAQAGEGFASYLKTYPNDPRQLEAAYRQAEAYSHMESWTLVAQLLQKPDGDFVRLSATDPKNSFVARGQLLLADALLALGKNAEGEKVVAGVDPSGLEPEWQWRRQYVLCRLELAGGRVDAAWQNSSNLLDSTAGERHLAAGRFLRGEILEALGRPQEALRSYTNNLAAGLPAEYPRQALLKIVSLTLAQNQINDAVQLLEGYVAQRTNGAALDFARLSLGELYLKLYYNPPAPDKSSDVVTTTTNYLQEALTNFDQVIQDFPGSPFVAKAYLDRGWCFWAQTNMSGARTNFEQAVELLHVSPEQAVARFKLADTEFYQHDYDPALTNYNLLLHDYANDETVTNELFDQALYQIVQVCLARNDPAGAESAVRKILDWYPNSLFGDRGQLLIGESRKYDYAMARQEFMELLKRSPQTPLLAEVQYAIARTYEQEGNWRQALHEYDRWLERHATNAPALRPQVEYARALVYGKAGMETNALALFTNFVARYPSNNLAPWAQNWVGDYYFNQGEFQLAEQSYELLYQTFPNAGDLAWEARLMAGRSALEGQRAAEAAQHFADLVAFTNAPEDLRRQGLFALGDALMQQFRDNPTNMTFLDQALAAFSKVTNGALTNVLAVQAIGKLGDSYKYWADVQWNLKHDPQIYTNAINMYQAIVSFPPEDLSVATYSQAEVALGLIAEREGHIDEALDHYCNVLYGMDSDHFDPYWVEQAGNPAARIYAQRQQWEKAIKVYQRVLKAVPSLRRPLEKAIIEAQTAADKARN